jgi:death on curing protein
MNEPVFLSREAVDLIHKASLEAFGGADGVRDENALESALAQPMQEYFYRQSDLFAIAAAYAFHIAENQPYIDGNKRTGLLSTLNVLAANGIAADQPVDEFCDAMISTHGEMQAVVPGESDKANNTPHTPRRGSQAVELAPPDPLRQSAIAWMRLCAASVQDLGRNTPPHLVSSSP